MNQQTKKSQPDNKVTEPRNTTTVLLLAADRKRAQDVLLQLQYQFSRKVTNVEIK